jgi:hypothetical protein
MSFREKSAWAMGAVVLLTGLFWLRHALFIPADAPAIGQIGPLIPYVIAVVVLSIAVQVLLAIASPRDAGKQADERERVAIDRAGNWSGVVLGVAAVSGVLHYFWYGSGNVLFLWVVGGLILAQFVEYALQIVLFRRALDR